MQIAGTFAVKVLKTTKQRQMKRQIHENFFVSIIAEVTACFRCLIFFLQNKQLILSKKKKQPI